MISLTVAVTFTAAPRLAAQRVELSDTFDVDAADWLVVDYPFRSHYPDPNTTPAPHDITFGNPAGSLRIGDIFGETGVAAPARYLGDCSAFYGGAIHYDIYLRYSDGVTYPAAVLNAGTMSVYYDAPSPAVDVWESRTIPLTEQGWFESGTYNPVSEATFRQVLANLQGLYIYTEWHTGADDTSFDNVILTSASSMMLDLDPDPLIAGQSGTFTVTNGKPNTQTGLVYSLVGMGSTYIPQIDVTLSLSNPRLAGTPIMTDGSGTAVWSLPVPPAALGFTVWFQAAQYQIASNVMSTTIQ